jgi:hypothetical protein
LRRNRNVEGVQMTTVPRYGDIEVDQDLEFQRRDWRAQRIGRMVLIAIVVAALAGAFGGGPIRPSSVQSPDGKIRVDYERIARHASSQRLRVHIGPRAPGDSVVDLWIDQEFMHGLTIGEISPQPVQTRAGDQRLIYRFHLADPSRSADVVFQADADKLWARHGVIGIVSGDSVQLRQFVLP